MIGCAKWFGRSKWCGRILALILLGGVAATPACVQAQDKHVVSSQELSKDAARPAETRGANEAALRQLFSSEQAQQALKSANLDYGKVDKAVAQLSDEDLAKLAARSRRLPRRPFRYRLRPATQPLIEMQRGQSAAHHPCQQQSDQSISIHQAEKNQFAVPSSPKTRQTPYPQQIAKTEDQQIDDKPRPGHARFLSSAFLDALG